MGTVGLFNYPRIHFQLKEPIFSTVLVSFESQQCLFYTSMMKSNLLNVLMLFDLT